MIKEKVQIILKGSGITQNDLADKLNITRQTLHYYLNGNITLSKLAEIAGALGVSPWELLTPIPQKPEPQLLQTICPYCKKPLQIALNPSGNENGQTNTDKEKTDQGRNNTP